MTFLATNWAEYVRQKDELVDGGTPNLEQPESDSSAPKQTTNLVTGSEGLSRIDSVLGMPLASGATTQQTGRGLSQARLTGDAHSREDYLLEMLQEERRGKRPDLEDDGPATTLAVNNHGKQREVGPNFTDDDYILGPVKILAFLLDRKQWIEAAIASLSPIDFYEHPFSALQLDIKKKKLIRALVRGFAATGSQSFQGFDDIVQGKGKGLFFLLHGDSGLGKTFTAGKLGRQIGIEPQLSNR
jgi:hypothetical protein